MKKTALIVISAFFAMGIAISTPAFATDSGLMSGMKSIAKEHAKGMVNEGVQKAGDTANTKIDELAGNTTAPDTKAVEKAVETKGEAVHEVEAVKGDVEKHQKALEELKHAGESAAHEATGK